ncbi:MAG: hypothetical protein ACUVRO_08940 [Armatimonadota bacterium]
MSAHRTKLLAALAFVLLSALTLSPCSARPGDVNGDGIIALQDALLTLRASLGLTSLSADALAAADVAPRPGTQGRLYGDGQVTVADAIRILQVVVGLLDEKQLAPAANTHIYALNGKMPFGSPGTVSVIDIAAMLAGSPNASIVNAFTAGAVPNHMLVADNTGYIVNSVSNTLQIVNLDTNRELRPPIYLGDGTNPMQVALPGNGKAYVSLLLTNEVAVVDLASGVVSERITVGAAPTGMAYAAGKVYVTNTAFSYDPSANKVTYGQGSVSVIDIVSDKVVKTIPVGMNPQYTAIDPKGRVHVSCTGDYGPTPGEIAVIDPRIDAVVGKVYIGGAPGPIAITFDGRAYAADSVYGVTGYDANTLQVTIPPERALQLGGAVFDLKADSMGRLYAALFDKDAVVMFDPSSGQVLAKAQTGSGPQAIALR